MASNLSLLREKLLRGIKKSMQSSYARRMPAKAAFPDLQQARTGLREFARANPTNVEGWRLLSLAEECLLSYTEALVALTRAIELTASRRKKDLKRLAFLAGCIKEWNSLPLSAAELSDLGSFLVEVGAGDPTNGNTFKFTKQWLLDRGFSNIDGIIAVFEKRGALTDFEVLQNAVYA